MDNTGTYVRTNRINSLQAGRAAAAIAVVIHHAASSTEDFLGLIPPSWRSIFEHGYLGVDFFFVLSGFIIFHTVANRPKAAGSAGRYVHARLIRIFVPYLPIALLLIAAYTFLPALSASRREWSWVTSLTLLPLSQPPALSVAWTLQHELIFYAIFGVAFFTGWLWQVLAIWVVAIVSAYFWGEVEIPLKFILAPINLEFVFGAICGRIVSSEHKTPWVACLIIAVLSVALWVAIGSPRSQSFLVGLAIAALVLLIVRTELAGHFAVSNWAVFLGSASYAIYLVHNPLLSVTARIAARVPLLASWQIATAIGIIASILAGCMYYIVMEAPLMRASERLMQCGSRSRPR